VPFIYVLPHEVGRLYRDVGNAWPVLAHVGHILVISPHIVRVIRVISRHSTPGQSHRFVSYTLRQATVAITHLRPVTE